jgi:XTP/dITP diphosphohydrolase
MRELVLATRNQGKVRELKSYLAGLPVNVHTLGELSLPPVEETGPTFEENARIKALHYSRLTDMLVLADDSGLEVDALSGQPGIHSARFGGPGATDPQRVRELLRRLEGTDWEDRNARFVCVMVMAQKGAVVQTFRGQVDGIIGFEPRGTSGFGYDPIFYYPQAAKTFAEMAPEQKQRVSHRGIALAQCARYLEGLEG